MLKQLRLLRTDPKYDLFKKIYAHLLICNIEHTSCFATASIGTNDLDQLLSDINATRNDLIIECVRKREKEAFEFVPADPDIKRLPYSVTIEHKPISQVRISTVVNYSMNYNGIRYKTWTSHRYVLPGFSPEDFGFSTVFKPNLEDRQDAFLLLMKSGLIQSLMIFQGKKRYVWTDEKLNELMQNLRLLHKLEDELFYFRSYFHNKPTSEEQRRLKFLGGELVCRLHLNRAELSRFDLKTRLKVQKGNNIDKNFWKEKEDIDTMINAQKRNLDRIIEDLKEEYGETIKKYPFLHEIISLACPKILQ
jgi:hypothetical protein